MVQLYSGALRPLVVETHLSDLGQAGDERMRGTSSGIASIAL
ncbi:MAG: hypothetical protein QOJ42_3101 [Acidobacteriaceae bacterium]|jgi:hypothetical protein|nr:hypothetical protein [Acidobacteriaceae bacterium]